MLPDLHEEIADQPAPEAVVGLDLFFDGNTDPASIGCNLTEHPGPGRFYEVLRAIRDRPEVYGVWVGITEVLEPDEWPFSDHVYVVTTAAPDEVAAWAAELDPEQPGEGWWHGEPPPQAVDVPATARVVTLWWD